MRGKGTFLGWRARGSKQKAARETHGMARTPEYATWRRIKLKCHDPQNDHFKFYGARGIQVCARWRESFLAFLTDVGERPSPFHTLERINNDGHYEPGNVCWATRRAQANNRRTSRRVTCGGRTLTIAEWSRITGIDQKAINSRLRNGWPTKLALTLPVRKRSHRGE